MTVIVVVLKSFKDRFRDEVCLMKFWMKLMKGSLFEYLFYLKGSIPVCHTCLFDEVLDEVDEM